ncbi:rhomboid family intramembrane serine protease [Nocardioides sp.]|uniref:rhomboid family intramembrane serine protease n=1 Tax=Nocardioides sp. TaxID=35761 RepID=UPI002C4583BA|nr:rhomboid family intramembrane serine protease [Nocardioides sp.]HXH80960.1 rhomboid family intramembrane serine protease [Nocardioides sp.]
MSAPTPPESAAGVPICYRHAGRETRIRCQRCERPICPECMRDASVGFQCPSCIKEGSKQTRSGRTAYGGRRSDNPMQTSIVLIGMNLAVWLAILATGWRSSDLINRLALAPRGTCESVSDPSSYYPGAPEDVCAAVGGGDGEWVPGVADGAYWQLITSAFTHVDVWHIGLNMLLLWILGPQLESSLGRARFLALYLLSALAGSAVVYWFAAETSATLGASGAGFGLMGALLVVAIKVRGDVRQILIWIGINVVITVVGSQFISWQGHLGGFLGGLAVAAILVYSPRTRRTQVQVLGLVGITFLLVALIVLRTAALV